MENAPKALWKIVGVIAVLEAVIFYFIFSWGYARHIDGLRATIQVLEKRVEDYGERLHLIPGVNRYENMTNAEVTAKARKLVETLREEERQYRAESDQNSQTMREEFGKMTTEEEKQAVWMKFVNQSRELLERQKAQHEQQHKNDAILIREEMLSRIPKEDREKIRDHRLAYIPPWFYEEIIDDLEMLASLLSGSPSSPPQK